VPATGSQVLPAPGSGTHIVKLTGTSGGAATQCQTSFTVSASGELPSCRNSVLPSAGFLDTRFDLCFFAANATRVDVFVDGVLKCTQLNPILGQRYDCFVLGSEVGPGVHVASIIATGCGGTCQSGTPFRVFNSLSTGNGSVLSAAAGIGGSATPLVSLSRTSVDFGPVPRGATAIQFLSLTNTGTAPLHISSIALHHSGNFTAFNVIGAIGTLAPNTSETITVSFNPLHTGPFTATVDVITDAPTNPDHITLTGTGT
jgi:hypothetical protein